jgi:two-component system response regulator TctD
VKLLLIEDNAVLSHWVARLLRESLFAVDCATDGESADQMLRTQTYDVVILDLLLPRLAGKEVLRRLRSRKNNVPVLVLTATGTTDEKVECLEAGADDYMVKPFEARELIARIKALARRHADDKSPALLCGDLAYSRESRRFSVAETPLELRPKEHAILEILMLRAGKTVSKTALAESIYESGEEPSVDAIEIYVHRLRKKLEHSQGAIMTLRGLGYILKPR